MKIFKNFSQFLETQLEEFLENNPHLELQALLEQLREQEKKTLKLVIELEGQEKRLENDILTLAKDIQRWHQRIAKAKAVGRLDLAEPAQQREAALLRQGNQLWGQMQGTKQQILQTKELLSQIEKRKQVVQNQITQAKTIYAKENYNNIGWNKGINYYSYNKAIDPLEAEFQKWELDDELNRLKKEL
ncbi:TIGR04376 family protein [Cyanobacterium sp. uoEpiScrs1]|uniref:TIGR04376 family protein n=1 Tax=Cyanobacterium sp. uoEpiScrs1 TaxID=2976343 RepID=UPI00226AE8B9|nr:TIGR04376 family protein [Cyanobacterium sp. uoEpiScrs1]